MAYRMKGSRVTVTVNENTHTTYIQNQPINETGTAAELASLIEGYILANADTISISITEE